MCRNEALGFYYLILIHFGLCIIVLFYVLNIVYLLLKYSQIQPINPSTLTIKLTGMNENISIFSFTYENFYDLLCTTTKKWLALNFNEYVFISNLYVIM